MRAWHLSLLVLVGMCLCEGYELTNSGRDNTDGRLKRILEELRNLDEPSYKHNDFEALLGDILHILKEIKAQGITVPVIGKVIEKINLGQTGRPTDTLLVEVPQEIKDCFATLVPYPNPIIIGGIPYPIYPNPINNGGLITCLFDLLWAEQAPPGATESDIEVLKQLPVKSGDKNRIRREYRTLSKPERDAFHAAVQKLIEDGTQATFARIHKSSMPTAHFGPAFLPWHRAFITKYEEALRLVDPVVTLPYWDSSLDNEMEHPVDSILWTDEYFGNGMGNVTIGPFAGAMSAFGPLERNYAEKGELIDKDKVAEMMMYCHLRNISEPNAPRGIDLEGFHNATHGWVGGDMGFGGTAGYDPLFFLHHSYIDYLWEKFREHQVNDCRVDPVADYNDMDQMPGQGPTDTMYGMVEYTIADGATNHWTQDVFKYEEAPSCENNCGNSPVLFCDIDSYRCASKEKPVSKLPAYYEYTSPDESGQYKKTSPYDFEWPWVKPNLTLYPPLPNDRQQVKLPLSLTLLQDLELQARMVPRNRGPAFLANFPSDGRTVRMRLLDAIAGIGKGRIG